MRYIIPKHEELDHCIVCGDPISVGTNPAICSERCRIKYKYLVELEKEDREDADARTA